MNNSPPSPTKALIRLLIVEDQVALAENLFEFFGEQHYVLDFAADGLTALNLLANHHYDIVVLDLMLPGVNGFELCRRIRRDLKSTTPIIMMTALSALSDKEEGFNCGADDYLVKPFEFRELQLRVNALHRRHKPVEDYISAGAISYHPGRLEVKVQDNKVALSGTPSRLFELLIRSYPNYLSHQNICEAIWGHRDDKTEGHSLRSHIYALRKTLKSAFGDSYIKAVHGRGYRLEPPEAREGSI